MPPPPVQIGLTLPVPNLLVPTPDTKGAGGRPDLLGISKTVAPMNLKFCRVSETSFNILEMLTLFTKCLLGYHSNSSKERLYQENRQISAENTNIQIASKLTILKITL